MSRVRPFALKRKVQDRLPLPLTCRYSPPPSAYMPRVFVLATFTAGQPLIFLVIEFASSEKAQVPRWLPIPSPMLKAWVIATSAVVYRRRTPDKVIVYNDIMYIRGLRRTFTNSQLAEREAVFVSSALFRRYPLNRCHTSIYGIFCSGHFRAVPLRSAHDL